MFCQNKRSSHKLDFIVEEPFNHLLQKKFHAILFIVFGDCWNYTKQYKISNAGISVCFYIFIFFLFIIQNAPTKLLPNAIAIVY